MDKNPNLNKVLNSLDILVTAFGAMIGWGWVVSTGEWLSKAGVIGAIIGFIIGGIVIYFIGLTYSELMTVFPKSGGILIFSYKAFGNLGAYISTWFMIFSYIGVVCFEACSISTVLQYLIPGFLKGYMYTIGNYDIYLTWVVVAVCFSLIITYVNIVGVKAAAIFQTVLTFVIGIVGISLVIISLFNGEMSNIETQTFYGNNITDNIKGILSVAVITPFFLFGFDIIPQVAEEINVPLRKIGKLMLLSILLAVLFYTLIIFSVGYILNSAELEELMNSNYLVTAKAMEKAFSSTSMTKILILGGICGIITSWNSFFIGGSRAIYSMSEANMLPQNLKKLHPKYKTPVNTILLIESISIICILFGRSMLTWISNVASFSCCIAYFMVAISFLKIRKEEPNLERPYKVRCYRLVGIIAVILSAMLLLLYVLPNTGCTFNKAEWSIILLWVLLGIYLLYLSKKKYGKLFGKIEI